MVDFDKTSYDSIIILTQKIARRLGIHWEEEHAEIACALIKELNKENSP